MVIDEIIIAQYVENFINSIIEEDISIKTSKKEYNIYINNQKKISFPIFKFYKKTNNQLYEYFKKETLQFERDFVGTIFFFISGYWEYINNFPKDNYGRVSARYSFQVKYDLLEIPIVDVLLKKFVEKNNFHYKKNKARYFLTHDIDKLNYSVTIKSLISDLLKRRDLNYFFKNLKIFFLRENPFSIKKLLEINNNYNINSNYYFLLGKQSSSSGYDLINNLEYLNEIKQLLKVNNQVIGLHYGFNYLLDDELSSKCKELLKFFDINKLTGRAHYLNFDMRKSFQVYEEAGIKIDCTGGYHDAIGFRFGTSFPFKPFNFKNNKSYNFLEIPLTIMDCTPFDYMKLNIEEGEKRIFKLIEKIIDTNGIICILWHNSSFWTKEWNEREKIYIKILKKIKKYDSYAID